VPVNKSPLFATPLPKSEIIKEEYRTGLCYASFIEWLVYGTQGADRLPPSSAWSAKMGKNQLNEEIALLLPTGIGKRF
jgi:hypothetical protein